MRYVDEYRDPQIAHALADKVARTATKPWVLMEVCGGQTHTLMRYGIGDLLPPGIELVHGPGCPVCVTPLELIDQAIRIAAHPRRDVHFLRRHAARPRLAFRPFRRRAPTAPMCASFTRPWTR